MEQLNAEIEEFQETGKVDSERMDPSILQLKCLLGADGVFAPFRPQGGSPWGKTVWKEIKVGVITRFKTHLNRQGKPTFRLVQRRLVAILGSSAQIAVRLQLEAAKQQIQNATQVIWISDGGKWLWTIYRTHFALYALGILDFYHAAENLWKGARAWLDGRTSKAKSWFVSARHHLRHGGKNQVFSELKQAIEKEGTEASKKTLTNLNNYLTTHLEHIEYQAFKQQDIPIGSGFVESTCKWLIQQRFKCVGMRWSEDGFSHLLHLRLLWVNQRFETLWLSPT